MSPTPATDETIATLRPRFDAQRAAFAARPPRSVAERRQSLDALADVVRRNEQALIEAISADFGRRAAQETRLLEWMPLLDEIRHIRARLPRWMRPERVSANWTFLPSRARTESQPLGVVGVIGAWNYPLLLNLSPLANALGAGNQVMIKPSERAPATAELLARMMAEAFAPEHVHVVTGGPDVSAAFSALPFDHLLFTGSTATGRKVMQAAAANLTPVTLELGGKSPALVHAGFRIEDAADRIVGAKLWNGGQTCVAPDYALVPRAEIDAFAAAASAVIQRRWPQAEGNPDYTHMIDARAWGRMQAMVDDARERGARVLQPQPPEGESGSGAFPPTLVIGASREMAVMQEEIFGPVLPVIGYERLEDALALIRTGDRPLAMYYFDHDRARIARVLAGTHAGGVTLNDCIFYLAQHRLPFGGIGASGMGAYHGIDGFRTFSHRKAVLAQSGITARVLGRLVRPPYGPMTEHLLSFMGRR